MWDLIVSVPDHCLSFYSDILSFMEPKIGNFVFHIFMYISVFTADFQKHNELRLRITAKNSKIHTNPIFVAINWNK